MANGTFGGGDGSAANPWLIEDAADLNAVRTKLVSHCFKLKRNIDLDVAPYNSGAGWTPIPAYTGTFDGGGYVIRKLKIDLPAADGVGLFATFSGAVRDLGLVDVEIAGGNQVGALAGKFAGNGVTVNRCYVTGTLTGKTLLGGLVGEMNMLNSVAITDCHVKVALKIGTEFAGGIAGYFVSYYANSCKVYNCFCTSEITGGNLMTASPLFGKTANCDIKECYYNKESTVQASAVGMGLTTAEFLDPETFDGWLYRYVGDRPLWKLLKGCEPKLWYEDVGRILVFYSDGYYTYDTKQNAWVLVSATLPNQDVFWEKGMEDLAHIPIAKLKELEAQGKVEMVCLLESGARDAKTQVELIFNVLRTECAMTLTSLTEKALDTMAFDFNPVTRALLIEREEKKNGDQMAIEVVSQTEDLVLPDHLSSSEHHVNDKVLLLTVNAKREITPEPRRLELSYFSGVREPYEGFVRGERSLQALGTKEVPCEVLNLKLVSQTERAVDGAALTDREHHIENKELMIFSDAKEETDGVSHNAWYEVYRSIARDRSMRVDLKGENKSRYLISVNNGNDWLTYDAVNKTWIPADLNEILRVGLTMTQLASPAIWESLPTDYRSKLKYAVGIRNESSDAVHKIQELDIEFVPNSGPLVQDTSLKIQSDCIEFSGILFDAENDRVEYQILTKPFNGTAWSQITPRQPGWFKRDNGYRFRHWYELTNFHAGDNLIKVATRDDRGVVYEKEFEFTLVTGKPVIKLNSHNEFFMNATVEHSLDRKIRFRILMNGKQMAPVDGYTEWKEAPYTFDFSWDSDDLSYGLPNEITIEAADELSTIAELKFHVIGGYRGLLFKDENNFYYSTDKDEILQQLDFDTVIGGLFAEPRTVFLENRTGLAMENISIWTDGETPGEKVRCKLSETLDPFVPVESIALANAMANAEVQPFYVRIESDVDAKSMQRKVFKIYAKGDPVVAV